MKLNQSAVSMKQRDSRPVPKTPCYRHDMRMVSCDGETDIMECVDCGIVWHQSCNFDDDMS